MKIFVVIFLFTLLASCSQCVSIVEKLSSSESQVGGSNKDGSMSPPRISKLWFETLRAPDTSSLGMVQEKSRVTVHYIARFAHNHAELESTYKRLAPFSFIMGQGQVMRGWEEGVLGMRPGEIRRVHIPSDKAFGQSGLKDMVPPDQDFVYDIELVSIDG